MCSSSTSNSGSRFSPAGTSPSAGCSVLATPARPEAYSVGRPSACSAALAASSSRSEATSSSRSWLASTTSAIRASGRSVLLTTRITGRWAASALRSTNRVCGSGPPRRRPAAAPRPPWTARAPPRRRSRRARGVDDVDDRDAAVGVMAVHGGVLGQDGDALFLLQVTAVQDALLGVVAAVVQRPGLPQHRVHQGGLAVVDVGDDGDVAKWHVGDSGSAGPPIANRLDNPGRSGPLVECESWAFQCASWAGRIGVSPTWLHTERRGALSYQPRRRGAVPTNWSLAATSRLR